MDERADSVPGARSHSYSCITQKNLYLANNIAHLLHCPIAIAPSPYYGEGKQRTEASHRHRKC